MPEITVETFREAAQRSIRNLDDEPQPEEKDQREKIREMIRGILKEEQGSLSDTDQIVRRVSQRVQDKITAMVWPEKETEIKRKARMMEVDRGAFQAQIIKEVKAILEDENG